MVLGSGSGIRVQVRGLGWFRARGVFPLQASVGEYEGLGEFRV